MIKLLYIIVGILLKQTIDEIKALNNGRLEKLNEAYEDTAAYRAAPAAVYGSKEAYSSILRAQHAERVQPELQKIPKMINSQKFIPLAVYAVFTILFLGWVSYLEYASAEQSPSTSTAKPLDS